MITFVVLMAILVVGAYLRFSGLDWDGQYHLHPDERFLTQIADQLRSTGPLDYLRTSESTLNPYNAGFSFYVYGNLPMTVTRLAAEWAAELCQGGPFSCPHNYIAYDGIHLVGRFLSGLVDLFSVLLTFLIGRTLYNRRVALVGAFLMAAAVLPIQQSHFFTMDNWAAALTLLALYAAVRISQNLRGFHWWVLFGLALGLAVSSRINVAPVALLAPLAAAIWLIRRSSAAAGGSSWRFFGTWIGAADLQIAIIGASLAVLVSLATFRLAQPYAFSDPAMVREAIMLVEGREPGSLETALRTLVTLNPQWRANMEEIQALQSPEASFPPAIQWTDRTPLLFPLTNLVLWGVGLAAGLVALASFFWALWQTVRGRPSWPAHALLLAWGGLYFMFMGTRWVKSIRYFLPIYPVLLLLAAWGLLELWKRTESQKWQRLLVGATATGVCLATLWYAYAFVDIYRQPVTRVEASAWMLDNIPTGATLIYASSTGQTQELQLPLRQFTFVPEGPPLLINLQMPEDGRATSVRFNYLSDADGLEDPGERLWLQIMDTDTGVLLAETQAETNVGQDSAVVEMALPNPSLSEGRWLTLRAEVTGGPIQADTSVISSEHWDDPLPVRYEGIDPYSSYYRGLSDGPMPITHPDNEEKRQSFLRWLDEADYIVLSSQRALWSLPRIPLTYPLTIQYYESLFAGELGFELVKEFHADLDFGPLRISDVAAAVEIGQPPQVGWPPPGPLAAEEAFSVYDHPPVWIFAKRSDFSSQQVRDVLGQVDLDRTVFMTPGEATRAPNGLLLTESQRQDQRSGGTFADQVAIDSLFNREPWLAAALWWLVLLLLGWLAVPVAFVIFGSIWDRGYALARIIAPLLIAYSIWLVSSLRIVPNDQRTLIVAMVGLLLISGAISWVKRHELLSFLNRRRRYVLFVELLALALFVLFLGIRAGNPDVWDVIWGGEKPMDLSYFNAVLKSEYFPPFDPWYAGGYINYYYFGFVFVSVPTKLLQIAPPVAYNLSLAMLFSFTGVAAFAVAFNLAAAVGKLRSWALPPRATVAGLASMTIALLLGNLGQPGVIARAWQQASDSTVNTGSVLLDRVVRTLDGGVDLALTDRVAPIYPGDWFWSASRIIQVPAGEVQPITEFPFFTFLYGDLHAHMIALPLTLVALAWAANLALRRNSTASSEATAWWRRFETGLIWGVGALSIGVLRATNTWDYPTYLLIAVAAVAYSNYRRYGTLSPVAVGRAVFQAALLVVLTILLFLPFIDNYGVGYTSFSLWPGPYTTVVDYLAMFGLSLFIVAAYLFVEFRRWSNNWTVSTLAAWQPLVVPVFAALGFFILLLAFSLIRGYWIAPLALSLAAGAGLLALRPELPPARRTLLALISVALALTIAVEIIVLDGDIGRMNTVFKFYLQAWMLLSIVAGVALVDVWSGASSAGLFGSVWRFALFLLIAAAALYPPLAIKAKWDIRMSNDAPATLDGMAFMQTTSYLDTGFNGSSQTVDLSYDYHALRWMWRNVEGTPVVAEAHSANPYRSIGNRVAMYTGLPTIIGWDWHQRQQRAVVPGRLVTQRIFDVNRLYETADIAEALQILDQYDVGLVYVGQLEWTYYNPRGLLKFDQMAAQGLLEEVYRNSGVSIYAVADTDLLSVQPNETALGQSPPYANK